MVLLEVVGAETSVPTGLLVPMLIWIDQYVLQALCFVLTLTVTSEGDWRLSLASLNVVCAHVCEATPSGLLLPCPALPHMHHNVA